MKITKLEHACLDITSGNTRLIVDPGGWTSPLADYTNISALVITHVHADHCDPDKVATIVSTNPGVQIFSTQQVAEKLRGTAVTVPELGMQYTVDDITLEFYGGQHAKIMEGYPPADADQNFGVLVNNTLYYPGDSFTPCPKPHAITAVPAFAPWLKFSETAEFVKSDSASTIFPTHNNIANKNGNDLLERMLGLIEQTKTVRALEPGDSIDA